MQQMLVILSMALVASGAAKAAPALPIAPAVASPFTASSIGPYGLPFAAYTGPLAGPSPLAISSSQRLDYFNQFNAAFAPAPAARFVATPAGIAALPFPAAAASARLFAPAGLGAGPFFF
ncbi:uncharacterized protein [Drosophila tropicalis]|uniref:Uncharacterized protein n=1 Tax=Drosophila willistoni TaxID=7260 RepID=B4MNE5_DROWI|nr:uncharacterized protein LOC6639407 [Drosophila willistoni]EDW72654.1 uncharacterized protein Dwil_GK17118 [Drosophila willistoni]